MLNGPFRGITTDGAVIPELYAPRPEGAPTLAMIEAVNALLAAMSPEQRKTSCFPVDSNQWRRWQNTELYLEHYGLRLDEISEPLRDAVLAVLRASMSQHGYELSRDVMKLNRFLGDIVHGPAVMGEWSYIFCLFGDAVRDRAVGLAVLRPSPRAELLRAGPADGADAGVLGRRAELRRSWPVQGHPAVPGRGARRA